MPEAPDDRGGEPLVSPIHESSKNGWLKNIIGGSVDRVERPVISTDEVFALLEYATNQGIEEGKVLALSKAIHESQPDPSEVAALYASVVSVTKPINGSTLIDSRESGIGRLFGISVATTGFFVLAIGNAMVDNWIDDMVNLEEDPVWLSVKTYVWDYLTPFFWGGLGSCIYLLKSVQDAARENIYEHHYMEGWGTRVLIGGVLAAIVLIMFDPTTLSADSLPLRPAAVAFLIGLGVKPVYGALEKTIEMLSEKLNLESIRRVPAPKTAPPKDPAPPGIDDA